MSFHNRRLTPVRLGLTWCCDLTPWLLDSEQRGVQGGTHANHPPSWCVQLGVRFVPWSPWAGSDTAVCAAGRGGVWQPGETLSRPNLTPSKHPTDSLEISTWGQRWGSLAIETKEGQTAGYRGSLGSGPVKGLRPSCIYLYFRLSQKHLLKPRIDQCSCLKDLRFPSWTGEWMDGREGRRVDR